jgi:hypothetical protein
LQFRLTLCRNTPLYTPVAKTDGVSYRKPQSLAKA